MLIGAVMILLSCSPMESQLFGTWERSSGNDSVVLTLLSDGAFVAQLENGVLGGLIIKRGNLAGNWRVSDGRLIADVTESITDMARAGHTWSDEVVEVSKTRLVIRPHSGGIEEYMRAESS